MDNPRESPWAHFDLNDHVTDMCQDDPRALPMRRHLWIFALPSPGIEEPNLHYRSIFARLASVVIPALHLYTRQMELAVREGMDPFHTLLRMTGLSLPGCLSVRSDKGPHSRSAGACNSRPDMSNAGRHAVALCWLVR